MKPSYTSPVLAAVVAAGFLVSSTGPAEARKSCVYMAHNDANGRVIAEGWAKAIKTKWACNRAQRRCNRRLNRKRRRGEVPRGIHSRIACRKMTNLSD